MRITGQIGGLPSTISNWLAWTIDWLAADEDARGLILEDIAGSMLAATGRKKTDVLVAEVLKEVLAGVTAWITGKTIVEIEVILGGSPDTGSATAKHCPRSRELVGTVIPRGMSFILGLVSHVVQQISPFDQQEGLDSDLVEQLSTAVRRGFDTPAKLQFALNDKKLIGRVQAHKARAAQASLFAVSIDDFP